MSALHSLAVQLAELRAAEDRVTHHLRTTLQALGFAVTGLAREADGWVLRIQPALAKPAALLAVAGSVEALPAAEPGPEAPPSDGPVPDTLPRDAAGGRPDPVAAAEPLVARPGEELDDLIRRESDALVLTAPGASPGSFALPLLDPQERLRLQAITMVGDLLLGAAAPRIGSEAQPDAEAVRAARHAYRQDGGDPAVFDQQLRARMPAVPANL